jgi:periplasmic divalent cation tolerance protein
MAEDLFVVWTTVPSMEKANEIAHSVVSARLAACVNIVPGVQSVYRFEGRVHSEAEVQLFIKTTQHRLGALFAWLEQAHPYKVPELLAVPVHRASLPYGRWLREETKPTP